MINACKQINYGFVIICPNYNIGQIKSTIKSIRHNYDTDKYVCSIPNECHPDIEKEINKKPG